MESKCAGPECIRAASRRGYCAAHYVQFRKYGYTWKFGEDPHRRKRTTCTFDGCENPNFSKGLCRQHKRQEGLGIELRPVRPPRPTAEPGYAWCSTCKQFRPNEDFPWDNARKQPKRACLDCHSAHQRAYHARHPMKARETRMKSKYGITPDDFRRRYDEQQGLCKICSVPIHDVLIDLSDARTKVAVDHDHKTGAVRGLLCGACNCAIGYMQDDPIRLESAARYLREVTDLE